MSRTEPRAPARGSDSPAAATHHSDCGIAADSRLFRLIEDRNSLYYYRPLPVSEYGSRNMLVRFEPGFEDAAAQLRWTLRELDPLTPYANIETLGAALEPEMRPWRLGAAVFTAFGLLALMLSTIGLSSAIAYTVSLKTREFGLRMAIGARPRRLVGLVLRDALRNSSIALLLGLAFAFIASPLLSDLLFQVSPRDLRVFGSVSSIIIVISTLASLPPALRAARVDPVVALRD